MKLAIVLLHGFSGSPENLAPVEEGLRQSFPDCRVLTPVIAGGWDGGRDCGGTNLDLKVCRAQFMEIISDCRLREEKIVLFGHSTGGNLLISFLEQGLVDPALLVLAGSPWQISGAYLNRWQAHSPLAQEMSLGVIAPLVSFVNRVSSLVIKGDKAAFPVLLMNGEADELVPATTTLDLREHVFAGVARVLMIPGLHHHFSTGDAGTNFFLENLRTAINDVQESNLVEDRKTVASIIGCEPEVARFVDFSPTSMRHLFKTPSGQEVSAGDISLCPDVTTDPVFANIEITTKCNLDCIYCARKFIQPQNQEMTRIQFNRLLDFLPHAYRVTIVGLGEPLLHSGLTDFIDDIEQRKRRSGIVTNALNLDNAQGSEILQAGLKSIAFSLDAASQKTLEKLRPGSDLLRIIANIKNFMGLAQKWKPTISSAVFSAFSRSSLDELDSLAALIATLGVHVWMVTDLNYRQNISASLSSSNKKDVSEKIRRAITTAFSHGLPVLSVRALEAFGLRKRHQKFLLFSPESVFRRSITHRCCHSPWQTIPINVNGDVTICDCQPNRVVGNLFRQPLVEIWNGEKMRAFRKEMTSALPPAACLACPRF